MLLSFLACLAIHLPVFVLSTNGFESHCKKMSLIAHLISLENIVQSWRTHDNQQCSYFGLVFCFVFFSLFVSNIACLRAHLIPFCSWATSDICLQFSYLTHALILFDGQFTARVPVILLFFLTRDKYAFASHRIWLKENWNRLLRVNIVGTWTMKKRNRK